MNFKKKLYIVRDYLAYDNYDAKDDIFDDYELALKRLSEESIGYENIYLQTYIYSDVLERYIIANEQTLKDINEITQKEGSD